MVNLSQNKIVAYLKVARPLHWIKNFSVFAAIVISGQLFVRESFWAVFESFWAFNLAASASYVFNDILDAGRDAKHPRKKFRPIASGLIPKPYAFVYAVILALSALVMAEDISHFFFLLLLGYLILQVAYSIVLKHLYIIDILTIASGFIIRVYAGAFVINAHLSVWFLLCVISAALFLASGKRRAEIGVVGNKAGTRESLQKYQTELLNSYVTMFGNAAWMSWALFTFFESPQINTPVWLILSEISNTASVNKLLMATIPVTIFGTMRYLSLIYEGRSEAPEKLLLTDKSLVGSVILWSTMVLWIIYGGITNY